MERVSLELSTELLARVDEAASATDTPRNAWIRRAIELRLAMDGSAQAIVSPRPKGGK